MDTDGDLRKKKESFIQAVGCIRKASWSGDDCEGDERTLVVFLYVPRELWVFESVLLYVSGVCGKGWDTRYVDGFVGHDTAWSVIMSQRLTS